MNVAYDRFNSQDVAKILGVAPQTVTYYVRHGFMQATNVSDGTNKARYMFTDEEVTKVQKLMKEHGKYSWTKYVNDTKDIPPVKEPIVEEQHEFDEFDKLVVKNVTPEFNPDKLMNKILKLRDLEEECGNVKARYNQICKEIAMIRNDIKQELQL